MPTIKLTDDLRVTAIDPKNWMLERRRVSGRGRRGAHLVRHPGRERWEFARVREAEDTVLTPLAAQGLYNTRAGAGSLLSRGAESRFPVFYIL